MGRKYLEGPDGLEQREEAIFDQLARLERYRLVNESTNTRGARYWWCSLLEAVINSLVMSVVMTAALVILGGGGSSSRSDKPCWFNERPRNSKLR
jgi:hypothetical protein